MKAQDKTTLKSLADALLKDKGIAPVTATVSPTLHKLVMADLKASTATVKAQGAEYHALVAVVKAAPFVDLNMFRALCDDIKTSFGDTQKESAQLRVNILNNARKIAHGCKVSGLWVKGEGMPALLEILDTITSIRTLKPALAKAKPDAAKGQSGGARTPVKAHTKVAKGSKVNEGTGGEEVPAALNRKSAIAAARAILKQVENFLDAGTDSDAINAIEDCLEALELAA